MTISKQQLVCTRPFGWFEVHPDGSVFLCCPAWLKRSIGNLLLQPVEEIWNGPVAQEIRKSILNGSFHNCRRNRCPHLLNRTEPISTVTQVTDEKTEAALATKSSLLAYLPRHLNLCFDHSCNLACPSCRKQILQAEGEDLDRAGQINDILLKELIPTAHSITLSGFGDPFGSATYLALLRQLNQHDFPQLQQLRLHTNGQLLTEKRWQGLPELQALVSEIEISIDAATEQTYRLNRPGGDFSRLLRNLEFLSTTSAELTLSMVVQQNNWREIPQLLALAHKWRAKLYLSQLVNWGTFDREEFIQRAVHLPEHEEYLELRELFLSLKGITGVKLGNMGF